MPMEDWILEEYQNLYKLISNKMIVPHPDYAGAYMYPLTIEEEEDELYLFSILTNKMIVPLEEEEEEEDEEEELHICGKTGREFDMGNQIKGCGEIIDDDNIMIGNISFCLKCGEEALEEEAEAEEAEACERYGNKCSTENLCSCCRTDAHYN